MNKAQLIELVQINCSGGRVSKDVHGKYHPLVLERYIELAYSSLLVGSYEKNPKNIDLYQKVYPSVSFTFDKTRGMHYSELPAKLVELPNQAAIVHVGPQKDHNYGFAPVSSGSGPIFGELEVNLIDDVPEYIVEGTNIYYPNITDDYNPVLMKLIPVFSAFGRLDTIYMPKGQDTALFGIVNQLMQSLKITPEDLNNDNNSKQV